MMDRWIDGAAIRSRTAGHANRSHANGHHTNGAHVDTQPTLQLAALDSFRSLPGGQRIARNAIDLYRTNTPLQLEKRRAAVAANDRLEVRRMAHTLKSSSAMLGAARLAHGLGDLEKSAEDLSAETLIDFAQRIDEEFLAVSALMEAQVDA